MHCCHCRWCQRETGASFALNAMIEADRVHAARPARPSSWTRRPRAAAGQKIARCPTCRIAVWSHYAGAGPSVRFVRVGTLDEPDRLPPDIHIFTASKQPWVVLPPGVPAVPEYYDRNAALAEGEPRATRSAARQAGGAARLSGLLSCPFREKLTA